MSDFECMNFEAGRDGLLCSHCGEVAVWPDEDGSYDDVDMVCAECGIQGEIGCTVDGCGIFQAYEGATCDRDACCELP